MKLNDYVVGALDLSNEPKRFNEAKEQSDWKIVMDFEMDSMYKKPNVGFGGIVDWKMSIIAKLVCKSKNLIREKSS
jgi:hypothetical protein